MSCKAVRDIPSDIFDVTLSLVRISDGISEQFK